LNGCLQAGGAEGAVDASNMLKPALARGELRCMGATTLDEYRKYIEKDAGKGQRIKELPDDVESSKRSLRVPVVLSFQHWRVVSNLCW